MYTPLAKSIWVALRSCRNRHFREKVGHDIFVKYKYYNLQQC